MFETLHRILRDSPIGVLTASAPDQAVALCVAHSVAAAIVDGEALRGQEWPVVKSLKMVRPLLPVIMVDERERETSERPEGIDAIVHIDDTDALLKSLKEVLKRGDSA